MSKKRTLTANWKREIYSRWGVKLWRPGIFPEDQALWVTRCSRIKNRKTRGLPRNLYESPINALFCNWVKFHKVRYGILSDKYGLHLDSEVLASYDIHPSQLTHDDKSKLGKLIANKSRQIGKKTIVFYNPSPLRSIPYFEMLASSGLKIFYLTKLPLVSKRELR